MTVIESSISRYDILSLLRNIVDAHKLSSVSVKLDKDTHIGTSFDMSFT